jgi:hypothetical protein
MLKQCIEETSEKDQIIHKTDGATAADESSSVKYILS